MSRNREAWIVTGIFVGAIVGLTITGVGLSSLLEQHRNRQKEREKQCTTSPQRG